MKVLNKSVKTRQYLFVADTSGSCCRHLIVPWSPWCSHGARRLTLITDRPEAALLRPVIRRTPISYVEAEHFVESRRRTLRKLAASPRSRRCSRIADRHRNSIARLQQIISSSTLSRASPARMTPLGFRSGLFSLRQPTADFRDILLLHAIDVELRGTGDNLVQRLVEVERRRF